MENLKKARKLCGYTQTEVSEMTGIPLGTLRRWEQGVNGPDPNAIVKLADLYGVTTDYLLGTRYSSHVSSDGILVSNGEEKNLIDGYRSLDVSNRKLILDLMEALQQKSSPKGA